MITLRNISFYTLQDVYALQLLNSQGGKSHPDPPASGLLMGLDVT
jgi:hypothetical protein